MNGVFMASDAVLLIQSHPHINRAERAAACLFKKNKKYHQWVHAESFSESNLHLDNPALCVGMFVYSMCSYFTCICVSLFWCLNAWQPFIFLVALVQSVCAFLNSGFIDAQVVLSFALALDCFNQSHTNLTVHQVVCVCVHAL